MNFLYNKKTELPPLAWLATLTKGTDSIEVSCGNAVVTTDDWFAAGVWDGDLAKGEMDFCTTCCSTGMKINRGGKTLYSNPSSRDNL